MAPITTTIEVARPPGEVFAYVIDPSRFAEWQQGVVGGHMDGDGPHGVGARCITTRRIGFGERRVTSEITHIDPPLTWGVRGIDGPIRAIVAVNVEPLEEGRRSRVTIELDFDGHGVGRVLVPLAVRRQARREMPANLSALKGRLEGQAGAALRGSPARRPTASGGTVVAGARAPVRAPVSTKFLRSRAVSSGTSLTAERGTGQLLISCKPARNGPA